MSRRERIVINSALSQPMCVVLATIVLMSAVPWDDGSCATSSECEQAIAALKKAGALIEYEETNARRVAPGKAITRIVFLSTGKDSLASLTHLKELPNPEKITLELRVFPATQSEKLARQVADLTRLKAVEIHTDMSVPVSDEEICHLSGISNLQYLWIGSLDRLDVTNRGLACLKDLRDLRGLALVNTRVTDAGLVHLKKLKDLESLSLMLTEVSGEGFTQLQELPLRDLILVDTRIDDAGLKYLQHFKQLERLSLTNCPIEGPGLKYLTQLNNLRRLSLAGTGIGDSAMVGLRELPKLEELVLNRCEITDASIPSLTKLESLERISLGETKISREGFRRIHLALPNATIEE